MSCGFEPGSKAQIARVHWPWDAKRLGRVVVITKPDHHLGTVFAHDDVPVTYRMNSKGRRVTDRDPRCIQSVYLMADLKPLPAGSLLDC